VAVAERKAAQQRRREQHASWRNCSDIVLADDDNCDADDVSTAGRLRCSLFRARRGGVGVPLRRRCNNDAGATSRASLQLADETDTDGDGGVVKGGDAWCGVDVFVDVDDGSDGNADGVSLSYDCRR
jgi:hypothetical protein